MFIKILCALHFQITQILDSCDFDKVISIDGESDSTNPTISSSHISDKNIKTALPDKNSQDWTSSRDFHLRKYLNFLI